MKTLRVRTKAGWATKPFADLTQNRLVAVEIDDNFLALESEIEVVRSELADRVDGEIASIRADIDEIIAGVAVVPKFSIGTVVEGDKASASITGTDLAPVLNLTFPKVDSSDISGLPDGGFDGQVLVRAIASQGGAEWINLPSAKGAASVKTNILTKNLIGRYVTRTSTTPDTTNVIMELESRFLGFRIGIPNIDPEEVRGVKVSVALTDRFTPPAWLIDIEPSTPWINLTFDEQPTATLAPRIAGERSSVTYSDMAFLPSIPRLDSPTARPLLMIRIEYPANAVRSCPSSGMAFWRDESSPRVFRMSHQGVAGVTDPASYTENYSHELDGVIPIIQYISEKHGEQLLIVGDQVSEGKASIPYQFGAAQMAAYANSTLVNPIEYFNAAVDISKPETYVHRIKDFIDDIRPTQVIFQPWSYNVLHNPQYGVDINYTKKAVMEAIQYVKTSIDKPRLIMVGSTPISPSVASVGFLDQNRRSFDNWLESLTGVEAVKGYANIVSKGLDSFNQTLPDPDLMNDDGLPKYEGFVKLASLLAPLIVTGADKIEDSGPVQGGKLPDSVGDLPLTGIAMAGLGNNPYVDSMGFESLAGRDYRAPEEQFFVPFSNKANGKPFIVRLDIALERLIQYNGSSLKASYVQEIRDAMDMAHRHNGKVVIDLHSYFRFYKRVDAPVEGRRCVSYRQNGVGEERHAMWTVIGQPDCPISISGLINMWTKLVMALRDHPALLGYGLMNEPHSRSDDGYIVDVDALWINTAQSLINAVRQNDTSHYIFISGGSYSSPRRWLTNSDGLKSLTDPQSKLIYEAHQYSDNGGGGGGTWENMYETIDVNARLNDWKPFIDWCRENGKRGFAGEFGGPAEVTNSLVFMDELMRLFIREGIPFAQWRAGPGMQDEDPNGMNLQTGAAKANAGPVLQYIGWTTKDYGPHPITSI